MYFKTDVLLRHLSRVQNDLYYNGGEWLAAVFPTGPLHHLTGFVHAEDRFWVSGQGFTGNGKSFKSVALGKYPVSIIVLVRYKIKIDKT